VQRQPAYLPPNSQSMQKTVEGVYPFGAFPNQKQPQFVL